MKAEKRAWSEQAGGRIRKFCRTQGRYVQSTWRRHAAYTVLSAAPRGGLHYQLSE
jgi:hypothetical protein